jgi:hypothetical protein
MATSIDAAHNTEIKTQICENVDSKSTYNESHLYCIEIGMQVKCGMREFQLQYCHTCNVLVHHVLFFFLIITLGRYDYFTLKKIPCTRSSVTKWT